MPGSWHSRRWPKPFTPGAACSANPTQPNPRRRIVLRDAQISTGFFSPGREGNVEIHEGRLALRVGRGIDVSASLSEITCRSVTFNRGKCLRLTTAGTSYIVRLGGVGDLDFVSATSPLNLTGVKSAAHLLPDGVDQRGVSNLPH